MESNNNNKELYLIFGIIKDDINNWILIKGEIFLLKNKSQTDTFRCDRLISDWILSKQSNKAWILLTNYIKAFWYSVEK